MSLELRKLAVLDLSVYNAVNLARRAISAPEIVTGLRLAWAPAWGAVDEVVTDESVGASIARLESAGLVVTGGGVVDMPVRDSRGLGRPLKLNADRTAYSTP